MLTTYFTSSKHVKRYIEQNGLPDEVVIEKMFDCPKEAREWESRRLQEMDAMNSPYFLNKTNNKSIPPGLHKGKSYEEIMGVERAERLKEIRRQHALSRSSEFYNNVAKKISKSTKGKRTGGNNNRAIPISFYYCGEFFEFDCMKSAAKHLKVSESSLHKFYHTGEPPKRKSKNPNNGGPEVFSKIEFIL